ncbi:MAG: MtnX-like HAD-IB family phosphatase [Ignavibacteria bacterium]|jgi:2,3-diketo-5-methylthio-1-phosphopentane phosphatase|nr:MtnX-like HAD-IB family phosphatase [Ignavibacteria bacterium]
MVSIYSDFDATISVQDVGDNLFQTFGNYYACWDAYASGECDIRELNRRLCGSLNPDLTLEEIHNWALEQELDAYFSRFLAFCDLHKYNFTVVSDGYDAYIKPLLTSVQCDCPYYCNRLVKDENGFDVEFFGASESCVCSTASCKRNVVVNNSSDEDIVIYIGDGHTDYCGAEHSDIVFAKSNLARYCNAHRIPHYPYKTFFDIQRILEKGNFLRHRHQSLMKRRRAFIEE